MATGFTFANSTMESGFSEAVRDHLKGIGRLFYIHSPQETLFERKEDVPNFFRQSWPYFFIFMILEHIVLRLEGKKGIRLNDGITSISHGILQECGRLLWRGAESYLYTWIYSNYRLIELPWDNTLTWYAAALGVDFCYYWMHRACHEVHILWAQHQVHHTSEDFNMGVGIRQSALQGWCGFVFYLPLALCIPPAQFIMHHQFSYIYMFWIHTETVKSLGPLEYVLNTPSHHRVHHGSNIYCLDVNYGGVLIIWDRIFGTFRPETDKIDIVYGLIYNQPSFNPVYLQSFYTGYVVEKFRRFESWTDKFRAVVWGPSWEPGSPRLGDESTKVDVTEQLREKYDVKLPAWCNLYLVVHYSVVLYGFFELSAKYMGMTPLSVLIFVAYIIASLTIIGMLFDSSKYAPVLEVLRCSALAFLTRAVASPGVGTVLQTFYVMSAMFWCLYTLKLLEIKKQRKVD